MGAQMLEKIDPGTRLFNLTCALLYTQNGLTKEEIFSRVKGYSEKYQPYGDNEALNRLFERDKSDLKTAGIQWVVKNPETESENNQEARYSVPKQEFLWPADVHLSSRQVALLNLAASVWVGASLSSDAANAALRIRGLGEVEDLNELSGLAPRIRTHHSSFTVFAAAIERGSEVTFGYRKPGATQVEKRTFRPWQLQNISGQWLVVGFDVDRQDSRSFLLRRIISKVVTTGAEPKLVSATELAGALESLNEFIQDNVATLKVTPDTEAWFRFEMDDVPHEKADEVSFNFMDIHLLADELRQYAADITVLRPTRLRDLIDAGFEKVVELHHD
jgi:proteasome accessory factor B